MTILQNTDTDTPYEVKGVEESFTVGDMIAVIKLFISKGYREPIYVFKNGNLMTNSREFAVLVDNF